MTSESTTAIDNARMPIWLPYIALTLLCTIVGMWLVSLLVIVVPSSTTLLAGLLQIALYAAAIGLVVGVGQSLVLSRYKVGGSRWLWVVANAVSGFVFVCAALLIDVGLAGLFGMEQDADVYTLVFGFFALLLLAIPLGAVIASLVFGLLITLGERLLNRSGSVGTPRRVVLIASVLAGLNWLLAIVVLVSAPFVGGR